MADERGLVRELSDDECWALLVEGEFGRLALSIGDRPFTAIVSSMMRMSSQPPR